MYVDISSRTNINRVAEMVKTWQDKRIKAINRKIKNGVAKGYSAQNITESYIDEYDRICNSQASNKEEYKAECEHQANDYYNACME
jgi:hypothetical protein|tara:strand:- start:479 stop:736 length:258 start_codon:yes stop_codon:yes gene_type:complete